MFGKTKKELKAAKEEIAELSRRLMERETELEYIKAAHDDLAMENDELTAKLDHIREVNRNRQTKFRNKNKK